MNNLFNPTNTPTQQPLGDAEKLAWLRLFRTENVGPITFYRLLEFYGSAENALDALPELAKRGGKKKPLVAPSDSNVLREYEALQRLGGEIVTAACPDYPLALAATDDAPPVLSYFGDLSLAHKNCIGMVGSRNASMNGRKFTEKLSRELGGREVVIVSGLARGIDTAAHKGSIDTGTIAVVAGGIDVIYPEENASLYELIKEQGLILAESPLQQKPFAQSFPKRNRIVSGLSTGVVVVEANMRSGSLITARLAGEQGRDVYAVPGHPMDPRAAGTNHLIREGATLVRGSEDILENLLDFSGNAMREPSYTNVSSLEPSVDYTAEVPENAADLIAENLSFTPLHVDELIRNCHLSVSCVQTALLEMELAGRVKRLPGNRVQLIGE